ncbi:MAG TPA: hypothetical protein VGI20_15165 [Rhizomicrobium sp.]|jgi:hypothetical protein
MSRLNFSVNAHDNAPRRRGYNPRGRVAMRASYNASGLYLLSVVLAMIATFAIVWYA